MRLHQGDRATLTPADDDPYILNFQRHVIVARVVDDGYMIAIGAGPPGMEYGPIPEARLTPRWVEADGRVRA